MSCRSRDRILLTGRNSKPAFATTRLQVLHSPKQERTREFLSSVLA